MLSSEELNRLRENIDHLDLELLNLLSKRSELCDQVGQHKVITKTQTRDLEREKDLIEKKISLGNKLGLNTHYVHQLFDLIIEQSVRKQYQMKTDAPQTSPLRVAYLGDQGSYSHQALLKYFEQSNKSASPFGYKSFKEIYQAVVDDQMDLGILPIENTTSGAILEVYDLLQGSGIKIVDEEILEIKHCLVGQLNAASEIKTLLAHPQAISQCSDLLLEHPEWKIEYCSSSAAALEEVIKRNDGSTAALANQFAADLYNLKVVKEETANNRKNYTRFIFISKTEMNIPEEIPCKVSLVFSTSQRAGALADVLNSLKENNIVLTKLQSRPIPEMPWQEMFYMDLEGHLESPQIKRALDQADTHCKYLKILGCYPNSQLEKPKVFT